MKVMNYKKMNLIWKIMKKNRKKRREYKLKN